MLNNCKGLALGLTIGIGSASTAIAQTPGLPVLQNAFSNQGLAVAANFGGGSGQNFFGLAGGWGMGSGRLQLSAAAGAQRANDATRGAYGGRASLAVWTSSGGSIGVGAFGGVGGAPRTRTDEVTTNAAVLTIPVGVTAGYRRWIGRTRGFSAFASPLYRWTRSTIDEAGSPEDRSTSGGNFRVALGVDMTVTPSLGATVGTELGAGGSGEGAAFGLAVSWVPGRR